jgi:hypothetical protein
MHAYLKISSFSGVVCLLEGAHNNYCNEGT